MYDILIVGADSRSCFLFLLCFSTCMRMSLPQQEKAGRVP